MDFSAYAQIPNLIATNYLSMSKSKMFYLW